MAIVAPPGSVVIGINEMKAFLYSIDPYMTSESFLLLRDVGNSLSGTSRVRGRSHGAHLVAVEPAIE
jgi:hypothetical protein